ncbi:MAG: TIGR00730 family Rossman fold protein, partial [Verrucomicrobiota bacterium]
GGGSYGLMGAVADGCLGAGGEVTGVITEKLRTLELAHPELTSLEIVPTMHERKARMAELADGFLALPGGIGTLEELFEALTWSQLEIHQKPCAVLNEQGFYDDLLTFFGRMVDDRFLLPEHAELLLVGVSLDEVMEKILSFRPSTPENWVSRKVTGQG